MKKDPRVYLAQILERIDRILAFTSAGKEAFFADVCTQDAVLRNFEVIGEAVKRLPEDFRQAHPAIPWRNLAGLRDVLIHQYEGISLKEVWRMVEKDLGPLRQIIAAMLPPLEELERELAGKE
jgi:uncharacterized protein with HEPN domain|uniref:DUF86 domain-containing protein n=1 Tax=Desulfobacca acetoxidans TaxID=60893 RepID=A0A7C3Z416_9BACT